MLRGGMKTRLVARISRTEIEAHATEIPPYVIERQEDPLSTDLLERNRYRVTGW